jgi:hypothetical protein
MARITRWTLPLIVVQALTLPAQGIPNFTGTWVVVTTPGWMTTLSRNNQDLEIQLVVKQSSVMLTSSTHIVSKMTGKTIAPVLPEAVWYLDGHAVMQRKFDGSTETTRTVWEGTTLTTTFRRETKNHVVSVEARRWFLDKNQNLVIDGPGKDRMMLKRK